MANTKQNQNFPPQALIFIGVVFIIASAIVGYLGIYDPAEQDYQRASANLESKRVELENVKVQEEEYTEYKKASERLEKRLDDLKAKIPSTVDELNKFLASINQRARSSRVAKWTLYKQEGNIPKGDYEAIPIRMEFIASYEAALQFFWDLASMGDGIQNSNREQLINIRDVQITRDTSMKTETMQTLVKVICVAETYLYRSVSAPAPKN